MQGLKDAKLASDGQNQTLAARTEEEDQREEEDETMAARMEDGAPQSDPSQAKRIVRSPPVSYMISMDATSIFLALLCVPGGGGKGRVKSLYSVLKLETKRIQVQTKLMQVFDHLSVLACRDWR